MRLIGATLFVLSLVIVSTAQTPTASQTPLDLAVLQFSWDQRMPMRANSTQDGFDAEAGTNPNARTPIDAAQADASPRGGRRAAPVGTNGKAVMGSQALPVPTPNAKAPDADTPFYIYQVKIKNNGTKTIKAIVWDYAFADPDAQNELAHHAFRSIVNLKPTQSKKLSEATPAAPTNIVNVKRLNSKERQRLVEQIIIIRLEYTDGTVWEHPDIMAQ